MYRQLSVIFFLTISGSAYSETVDGNFGTGSWVSQGPDGTVYDASRARWDFRNSDEDHPVKSTEGCNGPQINKYPVSVRNYDSLVLQRPLIEGHISLTAVWGHLYDGGECNSSSIIIKSSDDAVIDGARITKTWDAIRPASREDEYYTVRNTWISDARDDCIEADGQAPGLIENSLLDGCFQGISMRPGKDIGENNQNTLTIRNTLIKIKAHNHSEANGSDQRFASGQIFKTNGKSPRVEVENSVFAFDTPDMEGNPSQTYILLGDKARGGRYGEDLKSCSNNRILWMHDDNPPEVLTELDPCFTLVTGAQARTEWESRRCGWINSHPSSVTRRAPGDPESCDGGDATINSTPNPPQGIEVALL